MALFTLSAPAVLRVPSGSVRRREPSQNLALLPLCQRHCSLPRRFQSLCATSGRSRQGRCNQAREHSLSSNSSTPGSSEASSDGVTTLDRLMRKQRDSGQPADEDPRRHKELLAVLLSVFVSAVPWCTTAGVEPAAWAASPVQLSSPDTPAIPTTGTPVTREPGSFDLAFLFGESTETTGSGRVLPSKYVSSVRAVVLRLRESLAEDTGEKGSKFREKAEAAKDAIRNYLQQWRGKGIAQEVDSALETALRELSGFYSKNGPRAVVPADTKSVILEALKNAESSL